MKNVGMAFDRARAEPAFFIAAGRRFRGTSSEDVKSTLA
jgi:hypothetical protein